jgi:hypothetical protein
MIYSLIILLVLGSVSIHLDSNLFFTNYTSFMCLLLFLQRVADWISQSKELLKKRTSPEARTALDLISNALHISPHSDSLMEIKAEALLVVCIPPSPYFFHKC